MAKHPEWWVSSPKPREIRAIRESYKLSQSTAAESVYVSLRTWQNWESGKIKMHAAIWMWFKAVTWDRYGKKRS